MAMAMKQSSAGPLDQHLQGEVIAPLLNISLNVRFTLSVRSARLAVQ